VFNLRRSVHGGLSNLKLIGKTNWALFVGRWATRFSSLGTIKDGHAAGVRCGFPNRCHPRLFRDTFELEPLPARVPLNQAPKVWVMTQSRRQKGLLHCGCSQAVEAKRAHGSSDPGSRNQGLNDSATTITVSPSRCHLAKKLQRIDCETHEMATSRCVSGSTLAPTPRVCEHGNDSRGSTKGPILDSLTSLLARSFFAFAKHAIEFDDKGG
jgi:hypothetical protein